LVHRIDLRGDLQRQPRRDGDGDCPVDALFRRDAAEESQIVAPFGLKGQTDGGSP
jgi:hypothetical protein